MLSTIKLLWDLHGVSYKYIKTRLIERTDIFRKLNILCNSHISIVELSKNMTYVDVATVLKRVDVFTFVPKEEELKQFFPPHFPQFQVAHFCILLFCRETAKQRDR